MARPNRAGRWLAAPPGRLMTITSITLATLVGAAATWVAVKQLDATEGGVASNALVEFSSLDGFPAADLARVNGLAVSGVIANTGPAAILVTRLEAELYDVRYEVLFASSGNCHGGPLRVDTAELVPIEIFIADLPGTVQVEAGRDGEPLVLVVVDAEGTETEIRTSLPDEATHRQFADALIDLEAECRGIFLP
ncbi:hypothetical protein AB0I28_35530 [Phytomonospora sp. NPDC050363]|uniref:hypothetical protein n=1 Tax=Phytomonospora sp. NPDC050363 TaxID=3155642 RepID=UPI0033C35ECF